MANTNELEDMLEMKAESSPAALKEIGVHSGGRVEDMSFECRNV